MGLERLRIRSGEGVQRVLVVDDDHSVRALVAHYCSEAPWETVFAADGESALAAFGVERWDAVLLDQELPGLKGGEVARAMRGVEGRTGRGPVPILVLSAGGVDGALPRDEGFSGAIRKPFTRQGLLEAVGQALGLGARPQPEGAAVQTDPALVPLLPKFYDSIADLAADAAAGLETGDMDAVAKAGHKMRGAASCFGVQALSLAATRLESAAEAGDDRAAAQALDAVLSALHSDGA